MSVPAQRRPIYEDLRALPENVVGQILGGELLVAPRPANRHAWASSALGALLGPFSSGKGSGLGWWILDEPELHLGDDVLVPDLAAWRRQRLPAIPDAPYLDLSPDWACEILSDSTGNIDRVRKLPRYAAAEVQHAWVIDPAAKTLEVFRRSGRFFTLIAAFEGAERVRAEPFESAELDLSQLWI